MAYDHDKLFNEAMAAIQEHKLFFIEDVIAWLAVSKPTFYDHFKVNSDEFNSIKDAIGSNRIRLKVQIRAKLSQGKNAAELLALYKLICTDEERRRLSMTDVNINVKRDDMPEIDLGRLTKDERAQFYKLYNKARITDNIIDIDHEELDGNRPALGE